MTNENRTFKNNVFISKTLPEIAIRLPEAFAYVGQTAFILDQKAEVDRHHFLEPDADGTVSRLIILHFESFLPTTDQTINYRPPDPPRHAGPNYRFSLDPVQLGAHDYFHNTWFFNAEADVQAEPDRELGQTARLLSQHEYTLPGELRMSRYVRVVDAARKSELILFYMEPLAPTGFRLADFVEGGAGAANFDRLSAEITARSAAVFKVEHG